jgi:hypothetical protein
MSKPRTIDECIKWMADCQRIMKEENGAGDYRMFRAAQLSYRQACRELMEAEARATNSTKQD